MDDEEKLRTLKELSICGRFLVSWQDCRVSRSISPGPSLAGCVDLTGPLRYGKDTEDKALLVAATYTWPQMLTIQKNEGVTLHVRIFALKL